MAISVLVNLDQPSMNIKGRFSRQFHECTDVHFSKAKYEEWTIRGEYVHVLTTRLTDRLIDIHGVIGTRDYFCIELDCLTGEITVVEGVKGVDVILHVEARYKPEPKCQCCGQTLPFKMTA